MHCCSQTQTVSSTLLWVHRPAVLREALDGRGDGEVAVARVAAEAHGRIRDDDVARRVYVRGPYHGIKAVIYHIRWRAGRVAPEVLIVADARVEKQAAPNGVTAGLTAYAHVAPVIPEDVVLEDDAMGAAEAVDAILGIAPDEVVRDGSTVARAIGVEAMGVRLASRVGREDAAVVYPVVRNNGAYRVLMVTDARGALVVRVGTRDNGRIVVAAVY